MEERIVVKLGKVPDPVCIIGKMEICLQEHCPYGMWDGQRCLAVGKKRVPARVSNSRWNRRVEG